VPSLARVLRAKQIYLAPTAAGWAPTAAAGWAAAPAKFFCQIAKTDPRLAGFLAENDPDSFRLRPGGGEQQDGAQQTCVFVDFLFLFFVF
jgi:hypothetical protein